MSVNVYKHSENKLINVGGGGSDIEQFIGTKAEWESLSETEKDKYIGREVILTDDNNSSEDVPTVEDKIISIQNGYISPSGVITASVGYCYSEVFQLKKGQTVQFNAASSSGACTLSEWNSDGSFKMSIIIGDSKYHRYEYTAESDMFIRVCTRCTPNGNAGYVPMDDFNSVKLYYKETFLKNEKLNHKKIIVIGDSLIYGNTLGNEITWLRKLELITGATVYNYGINSNALSSTSDCMAIRYSDIPEIDKADIIIVEGGSNDKNQNVPIGTDTDTDITTFKGGCNVLIDGLRAKNPKSTILFMTTYHRYSSKNTLNLKDVDYANAMMDICKLKAIPCYNNCESSGITFLDENLKSWCDEGVYLGKSSNQHFSPAGYDYITLKYKVFIENNL